VFLRSFRNPEAARPAGKDLQIHKPIRSSSGARELKCLSTARACNLSR
jgi:hypothetical protein